MNICIVHKKWNDDLVPETGFYGDVNSCLKTIRKTHPQAFPWDSWISDDRFREALTSDQRAILGTTTQWQIVWGGPFDTSVAILVRSFERGQ